MITVILLLQPIFRLEVYNFLAHLDVLEILCGQVALGNLFVRKSESAVVCVIVSALKPQFRNLRTYVVLNSW